APCHRPSPDLRHGTVWRCEFRRDTVRAVRDRGWTIAVARPRPHDPTDHHARPPYGDEYRADGIRVPSRADSPAADLVPVVRVHGAVRRPFRDLASSDWCRVGAINISDSTRRNSSG